MLYEVITRVKAYSLAVINLTKELVQYNPVFLEQIKISISNIGIDKPGLLFDMVASFLSADGHQLQELLETRDLFERSEKLLVLIKKEIEVSRLEQDIQKQIRITSYNVCYTKLLRPIKKKYQQPKSGVIRRLIKNIFPIL